MKDIPNINEFLNSLLDDELAPRERIQAQRMIAHDRQLQKQLRQLQKCRTLIGSLPLVKAPEQLTEKIKAAVQIETTEQPQRQFDKLKGARHLLFRKVLSVAAMVALLAILGTVVYTIVAPEKVERPTIVGQDLQVPATTVEVDSPEVKLPSLALPKVAKVRPAEPVLLCKLRLSAAAADAIDSFVSRAIQDNGLSQYLSLASRQGKNSYALTCSRKEANLLFNDLAQIWPKLDSATLTVQADADQSGQEIIVKNLSSEQFRQFAGGASLENCVQMAKNFTALNNMTALLPAKEILTTIADSTDERLAIPKPVFTSNDIPAKKQQRRSGLAAEVYLTINITGIGAGD
ncbi:MAG: hypothetical protein JXB29_12525 [Sedimentisphaerales bacterium]|nr:hypothetical protein [Sedimentisphaerales bacterium]